MTFQIPISFDGNFSEMAHQIRQIYCISEPYPQVQVQVQQPPRHGYKELSLDKKLSLIGHLASGSPNKSSDAAGAGAGGGASTTPKSRVPGVSSDLQVRVGGASHIHTYFDDFRYDFIAELI